MLSLTLLAPVEVLDHTSESVFELVDFLPYAGNINRMDFPAGRAGRLDCVLPLDQRDRQSTVATLYLTRDLMFCQLPSPAFEGALLQNHCRRVQ